MSLGYKDIFLRALRTSLWPDSTVCNFIIHLIIKYMLVICFFIYLTVSICGKLRVVDML